MGKKEIKRYGNFVWHYSIGNHNGDIWCDQYNEYMIIILLPREPSYLPT